MRVTCVQHEAETAPGAIRHWAERAEHELQIVRADRNDSLPTSASDTDLIIILGGTMNVPDAEQLPWLARERQWLCDLLERNDVPLLGICLGAQLIADALGADVGPIAEPERGWMRFELTGELEPH